MAFCWESRVLRCSTDSLWLTGSESVLTQQELVDGLPCPAVHQILVFQPGVEPVPPALEAQNLATGPPGKSQESFSFITYLS